MTDGDHTVDIGGFIMCGAHSSISSYLGLAVNAVTQVEVTYNVSYLMLNDSHNAELFWALNKGEHFIY